MSFWTRLGDLFAPRITITKSHTTREMTPEEAEAFGAAFDAMSAAVTKMTETLDALNKGEGKA